MIVRMQVTVTMPATLADLEAACASARAQGMRDDATVTGPNLFSAALVVSQPATPREDTPR